MLLGDDVIDAKREGIEFGGEAAVLARLVGACKYELAQRLIHATGQPSAARRA